MPLIVVEYVREDGSIPYEAWFNDLPAQAAAKGCNREGAPRDGQHVSGQVDRRRWRIWDRLGTWLSDLPCKGRLRHRDFCSVEARSDVKRRTSSAQRRCGQNIGRGKPRLRGRNGKGEQMALTRDSRKTVAERAKRDGAAWHPIRKVESRWRYHLAPRVFKGFR